MSDDVNPQTSGETTLTDTEWGDGLRTIQRAEQLMGAPGLGKAADLALDRAVAAMLRQAAMDWWAHGGPHCPTAACADCDDDARGPYLVKALAVAEAYLEKAGVR